LPDLRGRVVLSLGQGPGLSNYLLAQNGGQEAVTVDPTQIPSHAHPVNCNSTQGLQFQHGTKADPAGNFPATQSAGSAIYQPPGGDAVAMNPQTVGPNGGGLAHENHQPYLALNYIICLQGVFPPRT
jgi:microcystin-dependent protein